MGHVRPSSAEKITRFSSMPIMYQPPFDSILCEIIEKLLQILNFGNGVQKNGKTVYKRNLFLESF